MGRRGCSRHCGKLWGSHTDGLSSLSWEAGLSYEAQEGLEGVGSGKSGNWCGV